MKYYRELLMTIMVGGLIYLWFYRGPEKIDPQEDEHVRIIDSLEKKTTIAKKEIRLARDSIKDLTILSDTWFNVAEKNRLENKTLSSKLYGKDTLRNRRLSQSKRDSVIRATFYR